MVDGEAGRGIQESPNPGNRAQWEGITHAFFVETAGAEVH